MKFTLLLPVPRRTQNLFCLFDFLLAPYFRSFTADFQKCDVFFFYLGRLAETMPPVDFREPARGGEGLQQPGQRVPLSAGLRQGRLLPHAGAGAGSGAGRPSHRDEGVRRPGARRPVHAGRCDLLNGSNPSTNVTPSSCDLQDLERAHQHHQHQLEIAQEQQDRAAQGRASSNLGGFVSKADEC